MTSSEPKSNVIPEGMRNIINAVKANALDDIVDQFMECPSDADKVDLIWIQPAFQDVVALEPEYCAKSSTDASKYRQNGNKYFQKKAYLSAIGEYTKSILNAPCKTTIGSENELPLAFANRSAALFHFKKYRLCLRDIEFAMEHSYPDDMVYKLYDRQGKCYIQLGQFSKSVECFKKAEESLQQAKLDTKYLNIWRTNLKNEIEKHSQMKDKDVHSAVEEDPKRIVAPSVSFQGNEIFSNASGSIRMDYDKIKGRCMFAAQDIALGEVLVAELPTTSVLYEDHHTERCCCCFQRCLAPVPCYESSSVMYCSRECRDKAWHSHQKYEYNYAAVLEEHLCGKFGHLALRSLLEQNMDDLLEFLHTVGNDDPKELGRVGLDESGKFVPDFKSIYQMRAHSSSWKGEDLFDLGVVAAFLLKVAEACGALKREEKKYDSPEDMKIIGGALLRILEHTLCNSLKVSEVTKPNNLHEPDPKSIGTGFYPTTSLFNHSCDPLATVCFYGNKAVVRAIRNITKDQEITIAYGYTFYDDEELKRRWQLKDSYFFNCTCTPCQEGWPMWLEMDNSQPVWLCEACGVILQSEKFEDGKFARCKKCSHRQNVEDVLNQLGASHDAYSQAMAEALSGRIENALPGLIQHLNLQHKFIDQPWRDFTACQVAITHCFQMMANCKE